MISLKNKIVSLNKIINLVSDAKKKGKKVVTYNGSFDLIQVGHIKSIREAKNEGDILIVLLNSDNSVSNYKGPNRPLITESERAQMVAGIEGVDNVVVFDEINPISILSKIKPDVHCNGPEWGKNCIEREVVEKNGGRIFITKTPRVSSTSILIKKILNTYIKSTVKAIFFDRDGTINNNKDGYVHKKEDFEFLPGVISTLQKLSKTDYKIIFVTNQSGIGRGYFTEKQYKILTRWMLQTLKDKHVRIDKVYHCPHSPENICECRKPKTGMFLKAVKDFGISLNDSWFVGDDDRDVLAGRNVNIKTIKLGRHMSKKVKLEPNFYAKDLTEAIKIILG